MLQDFPDATSTLTQYRSYILEEGTTEGERLALQHGLFKPNCVKIFNQIMDEYGLAERINHQQGEPVRILDVGCGEGLYLHDVTEVLDSRHLLDLNRVQLIGLDKNAETIATAQDFTRASQPPRPYLEFFTQDLTAPFTSNLGLAAIVRNIEHTPPFDFIFAFMVFEHIHDAERHIGRLYDLLKPGGVLYLRDLDTTPPRDSNISPALMRFMRMLYTLLMSNNNGQIVAYKSSQWLTALGAEQVLVDKHVNYTGGTSREGMLMLKDFVYMARTVAPVLVRLGLLSKTEHEELLQALFYELSPDSQGEVTFVNTVARKPL